MAGAGYKLFATGDVLTASEVNTYLMQQAVMVFDDSAARTTALSGVVAEGMLSYLKDTNAVEVYDGSSWVASDDPNAIQNSIVDAKGDLISASADNVPARLAVGNDGESIVADSSTTTGLAYREDYAAGKNKVINGDLNINQRAFTTTTSNAIYTFDRFIFIYSAAAGTNTCSAELFTPGTAPVAGYEARNFIQIVSTGQAAASDNVRWQTSLEDVKTLAGQTATVSFWAKTTSGTPSVAVGGTQNFGSGGSPSADVNFPFGKVQISTTWTRYSFTVNIPSIAGKTIGTNVSDSALRIRFYASAGSDFNTIASSLGVQNATIQLWGIQLEAGNVATAFQTATGTLAGELAACQRYYQRVTAGGVYGSVSFLGNANSTTLARIPFATKQTFRVKPTAVDYANVVLNDGTNVPAAGTITVGGDNENAITLTCTTTGLTQFRPYVLSGDNNAAGFVGLSAEL